MKVVPLVDCDLVLTDNAVVRNHRGQCRVEKAPVALFLWCEVATMLRQLHSLEVRVSLFPEALTWFTWLGAKNETLGEGCTW